jgi:Domain of unknown function (DUF5916)
MPLLPKMFALLLCAMALSATLAQGSEEATTQRAVRLAAGETLVLDGSLAHPAWQRAPVYKNFVEKFPDTGAAPSEETRVQVLFDDQALWVGVTVLDRTPARIRDVPVRNDGVNRTQDFVVVYVDPIGQRRSAQFFRMNAAGSMADGLHTAADDNEDFAPDFDWDGAVQRNAQGWTAVFRLPFASLRYADGIDQPTRAWRFMVGRRLPRDQFHLFTSVLIPRDAPSFIHTLQPLVGVTLPENSRFLTLRPSLTLRRSQDRKTGAVFKNDSKNDTQLDTSLDVKWRPRAELVIDGTLKPDFSQVALDVPQLAGNSRFALYFPEKRPFFFESADLLRSPTDAFYTRSFTEPRWGARATWRSASWAGSALAVDDKGGGLVLLPGPYSTDAVEQPASTTVAARLRNDRGGLQWGAVMAARRYAGERGDNQVIGPDIATVLGADWNLRSQLLLSNTTARILGVSKGLARGPAESGHRFFTRVQQQRGDGETSVALDDIGTGFRHDTGFVNQAGVRSLIAYHSKGWHPLGPFNEFYVNVEVNEVTDRATGQVVKRYLRPGFWSVAARNMEWWLNYFPLSQVRSSATSPLLDEHYVQSNFIISPATWFPLLDTNLSVGRLADTVADKVRSGARWSMTAKLRPMRPLELEPSFSLAWLNRNGQRTYSESVAQMLAVWHFDGRHNLRAIVQRTGLDRRAEPGVTAERSASQATSLTYTWRRSAGTRLFVGASHSRSGEPVTRRNSEAFVKLQFDVDELRSAW